MSRVKPPWTCQFCKKAFFNDALPIIGTPPEMQNAPFIVELMKHLQTTHPQAIQSAAMEGQQFTTMVLLSCFQTDEETGMDKIRWSIHRQTRRIAITDERIETRVQETINGILQDACTTNPTSPANLDLVKMRFVALLQEMRNIAEERGRYT